MKVGDIIEKKKIISIDTYDNVKIIYLEDGSVYSLDKKGLSKIENKIY